LDQELIIALAEFGAKNPDERSEYFNVVILAEMS
jgi:hypothetical protein